MSKVGTFLGMAEIVRIQSTECGPTSLLSVAPCDFPAVIKPSVLSLFQNAETEVGMFIQGVGVSVIDEQPEECCYLYIDAISLSGLLTSQIQDLRVNIANVQIDVSAYSAVFPAILYTLPQPLDTPAALRSHRTSFTAAPPPASDEGRLGRRQRHAVLTQLTQQEAAAAALAETMEKPSLQVCPSCGCRFTGELRPFFHLCCQRHANQNCLYIDRGLVALERIVLKVDEQFVRRLLRKFGPLLVGVRRVLDVGDE